jgi:hypothetical protein
MKGSSPFLNATQGSLWLSQIFPTISTTLPLHRTVYSIYTRLNPGRE